MAFQISNSTIITPAAQQVSASLTDETVILNLGSGVYYGLDAVGARIWSLIQSPISVADIQRVLLNEYNVDPYQCDRDVMALIECLAEEGLIEISNEPVG
jgi:hypothetical protein